MTCLGCPHPISEHSRYIGCQVVVQAGYAERGDDTRDFPDVFCGCPLKGTLEDGEDEG